MTKPLSRLLSAAVLLWASGAGMLALTGDAAAQAVPKGMNLQPSASPIMTQITQFHDYILIPMVFAVSIFVLALLIYVMVRFRASANPVPSKTTHHTGIEVIWTVAPVLILVLISIPSFKLLYASQVTPKADITVKAIGYQWYWAYQYPDHGGFQFDSYMLDEKAREAALKAGKTSAEAPRLLAVDNEMVVPVGKVVRVLVTANDVIHAFAMQPFGIKVDAVPGRINETWFKADRPGIYFGQCSELCGKDHAFMPIGIRVLGEQEFAAWVENAKKKFAANGTADKTAALTSAR